MRRSSPIWSSTWASSLANTSSESPGSGGRVLIDGSEGGALSRGLTGGGRRPGSFPGRAPDPKEPAQGGPYLRARHDPVDQPMLQEELGRLESLGQSLADRLLDDPPSGEPDERARLRQDDIALEGEARGHPSRRGVAEDGHVQDPGVVETAQGCAHLRHLEEGESPLLHPRSSRGREEDEGAPQCRRALGAPGHFFSHDRPHAPAQELELHGADHRAAPLDRPHPGDDGFGQARPSPRLFEAQGVGSFVDELQGVLGEEPGVGLVEGAGVEDELKTLSGREAVVVAAPGTPANEMLGDVIIRARWARQGGVSMSTHAPAASPRGRPGFTATVALVLRVVLGGGVLGGIVLPQYFNIRPVFSLPQPSPPTPAVVPTPPVSRAPSPGPLGMTPAEAVIINVVKKVRPSVVNINTESQVETIFGVFPQQGAGSGVIVRPDGYILTNNHVVQGATTIKVTLLGGKVLSGRIVGTDPLADLAVIKVSSPEPLPAAELGRSGDLQVGQLAIAIGNPFGLGSTVTTGVISALNRNIQLPNLIVENLIQTSAAINPGNSGGALVDSSGRVIGINTAIIPNAQGIGFAIPSDVARVEMNQLIAQGRVIRPWVGIVYGGEVDPQTAQLYNLGTDHGVIVRQVEPSSPAARAGIQPGDIITAVNSDRIDSWNDFVRDVVTKRIGETITLTVVRDGATRQVRVVLAERPAELR